MNIFRNAVFTAAAAGLLAGLILAALQTYAAVPLILEAETFENAGGGHHHHAAPVDDDAMASAEAEAAPAGEEDEAWAPEDGFERFAYTLAINIVSGIGFGLLLVAVSELSGGIASWRQGVLWGLAGFGVFTLAPGLGLPPELPAMPAADLAARQVWWVATVIATGAGLWLIAFRGTVALSIVGLVLIVLPHIVGAPQPDTHETAVPAGLHHQFIVAVTVTNLIFWVALGGIVALVRPRFFGAAEGARSSFA